MKLDVYPNFKSTADESSHAIFIVAALEPVRPAWMALP